MEQKKKKKKKRQRKSGTFVDNVRDKFSSLRRGTCSATLFCLFSIKLF
jgi:hypothetical protein